MSIDSNNLRISEEGKVEFIKQSENEILIRTYRKNGEVVERIAIVMPPDVPSPAEHTPSAP